MVFIRPSFFTNPTLLLHSLKHRHELHFFRNIIYLKGRNFRGKKISRISRILAKFAKINSLFDPRKCQFAKIDSREIFQNWWFAKINSREIFQELKKNEYSSLCPRPSLVLSFFKSKSIILYWKCSQNHKLRSSKKYSLGKTRNLPSRNLCRGRIREN